MKRIVLILTLLLVLLLPSGVALAGRFDRIVRNGEVATDDITVVDDNLIVEEGGVVDGHVTVYGGSADIDGEVSGDVTIFGGQLALAGQIEGDLVIFGGNLQLLPDATVDGDCVTLGGSVDDESDGISCTSFGNRLGSLGVFQIPPIPTMPAMPEMPEVPELPEMPEMPEMPEAPVPPRIDVRPPSLAARIGDFMLDVTSVIGRSLLMGILALVIGAVFPRQVQEVRDAVRSRPATSGAVGLLTAVAGPSIIVLLLVVLAITCVGLLLYPAVFLLGLALVAAVLIGWIALGDLLGRKLLQWANSGQAGNVMLTAGLGTALLTLLIGGLELLPFIWGESLVVIILACVGLGAATLTKFGTKPYPPGGEPPVNAQKEENVLKSMPQE